MIHPVLELVVRVADLLGVGVFAITGGLVAVRKQFDVVGVVVLALVTGLGGGMIRDVLIGATPVAALDWRYLVTTTAGGLLAFRFQPRLHRIERYVVWLDALGLSLFCVTGSVKAVQYGVGPVAAALLGMITGVGGGIIRDLLSGRTPVVLREDVYAVPALIGGATVAAFSMLALLHWWSALIAGTSCFVIRALAIHHRWQAPRGRFD